MEAFLALAHALVRPLRVRDVERVAAYPHELAVLEIGAGGDQDMLDGAVLCPQPRRKALQMPPDREALQNLFDGRLIDVEIGYVAADIVGLLITQQFQFRLVGAQDRSIACNDMQTDRRIFEEVVELVLAPLQRGVRPGRFGNVLNAVDRAREGTSVVENGIDVDKNGPAFAIGPFHDDILVAQRLGGL